MSRMGNKPIKITENTQINIEDNVVIVKGKNGEIKLNFSPKLIIKKTEDEIIISRRNNDKLSKSLHGVTRKLIINAIQGVNTPFEKSLDVVGIGYRVALQGNKLVLNVGYSNPVEIEAPKNIKFAVKKNTITISGVDKQKVGLMAAKIREVRPPEPYKGKGIKYSDEIVKRKPGKAAKTAAEGK